MDFCSNAESSSQCVVVGGRWKGATDEKKPNSDGAWPITSRRINVLKYALIGSQKDDGTWEGGVFRDKNLLPDRKIRLSWQAMWNNGKAPDAKNVDSEKMNQNSMRFLGESHRNNFISFINGRIQT